MLGKLRSQQNHLRFGLSLCAATMVSSYCIQQAFALNSGESSGRAQASDAWAAKDAQSPDGFDSKKMAAAEKLYFGSSFEQMSAYQRMDKLEHGVFGRNRSGSLNKRFERIVSALGAEKISGCDSSKRAAQDLAGQAVGKEVVSSAPVAIETADSAPSEKSQVAQRSVTEAPVQALLKSGMTAHKSGQMQIAEGNFKAALALDPRCADAFYNLGSIAESKGDLLSALTYYRAALGINPLDRELQNAVRAIEDDVAKSRATAGDVVKGQSVKTVASTARPNDLMPKPAPAYYHGDNYQGSNFSGHTPNAGYVAGSSDAKLFNLQTAQNNALMQAQGNYPPLANVSQPTIPVYNVSQQQAPVLNVNQTKSPSNSNSGMNSLVNVLMMSTPLHCPICRLKQMGNW